ncbi:MAG: hypothetical protein HY770_05160 [Chitinivibrionia bacterium]|nr:hypothetical protein [Chitinivibrionia bacterium]
MDQTELLLKVLTEADGVAGHEDEIRRLMARELKGSVDEILYDKMGSIVGRKAGSADRPRVLVEGHMDEIGFMVKEITEQGFLKFLPLGGWWGHVTLGQRMRVLTSKGVVPGVVGSTPPHLLEAKDREKVIEIKDMFIDVGSMEKQNTAKQLGVRVGDPIVPESQFTIMGNKKNYLSKAFDNRMGCAVAIEVVRKLAKVKHPNTVYAGGSTERGGGDGGVIHKSRLGVPTIYIGAPTRYIHTHNAIMNRSDYDNTVKLLVEVIKVLDEKTVNSFTEA